MRELKRELHDLRGEHVRLNIEAKLEPGRPALTAPPADFAQSLIEVLHTTNMTTRATIQSFDWRVPAHVQAREPRIPTSYLSEQRAGRDTVSSRDGAPSP